MLVGRPSERLGRVVLVPVADGPAVPNPLRILRVSQQAFTLGPRNPRQEELREVAVGSAYWWTPSGTGGTWSARAWT